MELSTETARYTFIAENKKLGEYVLLNSILDFPDLYEIMPELKNMRVEVCDHTAYYKSGNTIAFKEYHTYRFTSVRSEELRETEAGDNLSDLIHEIQHIIQEREGRFESTDRKNFRDYYNHELEVEARKAASQRKLFFR